MERDSTLQIQQQGQRSLAPFAVWSQMFAIFFAWLFALCILIQVFLAGMSIFTNASWWKTHIETGHAFGFVTVLLLLSVLIGRFPRLIIWLSVLLIVQYALQYTFINVSGLLGAPVLAAFHPVNAMVMFWVTMTIIRQAQRWRVQQKAQS